MFFFEFVPHILLAENPVLFHLNGDELNLHDLLEIVNIPERTVFYRLQQV